MPIASTPSSALDFVHHDTPIEGRYAATLVILSKVKPSVERAIKELITARFDQQDEDTLLVLSMKLYGTAKFLEQVGRAQIQLMDTWMNPAIIS